MTTTALRGSMRGMDTDAGRATARDLHHGAGQIDDLAGRLDQVLHGFAWHGPDADRVRSAWESDERPRLSRASAHLVALAEHLAREAEEQDLASADPLTSGSAATGSGGVPGPTPEPAPPERTGGIIDWLDRRLAAGATGLARMGGATADLLGQVWDGLTGRQTPTVASLAAGALLIGGTGVGAVANTATGRDLRWLAEGRGATGEVRAVPPAGQGTQFQPGLRPPTDLGSVIGGVADAYEVGRAPDSHGAIRVTQVDNGRGPAYVVSIPGTESWSPGAGATARDLSANLHLVARNPTAAAEATVAAMRAAGIPPDAPVLLVGHSQGGIIAAQLAGDPAFREQFHVTNMMTFGAPIDHVRIPAGVEVMQIQHGADPTPWVDLRGVQPAIPAYPDRAAPVVLPSPGRWHEVLTNHNPVGYLNSVTTAMEGDSVAGQRLRDYQAGLAPFLVGDGGSVSAVDVQISREPHPTDRASERAVGGGRGGGGAGGR